VLDGAVGKPELPLAIVVDVKRVMAAATALVRAVGVRIGDAFPVLSQRHDVDDDGAARWLAPLALSEFHPTTLVRVSASHKTLAGSVVAVPSRTQRGFC
jgi:hypothetical protein